VAKGAVTYGDVNAVGDFEASADCKIRGNPGLEYCACAPDTWNHETKHRQRHERDFKRAGLAWARDELECCTNVCSRQSDEAAADEVRYFFAVVTALQEVRDKINLTDVDLNGAL
jgi:hypothetical protein